MCRKLESPDLIPSCKEASNISIIIEIFEAIQLYNLQEIERESDQTQISFSIEDDDDDEEEEYIFLATPGRIENV